jgi:glucose/mannose-6-phosphate isomerase
MKELVAAFPEQIREALEIGRKAIITNWNHSLENVLITGLGGSGIGGSLVSQLVEHESKLPIGVNKNYFLPNYINAHSLVIVCSYSGNTEETVNCLNEATKKQAKIVCITSGGKIAEIAKEKGYDLILIPGGMPPRSCLGYSLIQLFFVLKHFGIINTDFEKDFISAANLIETEAKQIENQAQVIAEKLLHKIPVIYADAAYESVAIRFRQQLNENSKILCWHHVFPEMNHNELVGWRNQNDDLAVIILRNHSDFERTQKRMEICKQTFSKYCSTIIDLFSKGKSDIEKSIYLIHITDWISCLIADLKGIDAVEVNIIDHLKAELVKN